MADSQIVRNIGKLYYGIKEKNEHFIIDLRNMDSIKKKEVWKAESCLISQHLDFAVIFAISPKGERTIFYLEDFSKVNMEKHFDFSEAGIGFFNGLKEFIEADRR